VSGPSCNFCGEPLNPDSRLVYRRVEGWERKAASESRRGGSDIVLREPLPLYACPTCIVRLQNGVAPGQEALL